MAFEFLLLVLLTLVSSSIGTLTGFGTSTIMVPIVLLVFPLPIALLFVGIIHWFGDIWKMFFFRSGVRWRLLFLFGGSGLLASYLGASFVITVDDAVLSRLVGVFLLFSLGWLVFEPRWTLPQRNTTALVGGGLSGFIAGISGVGGAVRGVFLTAYNLPKEVYLFTSGAIALVIDSTRLITYWSEGVRLPDTLLWSLIVVLPVSLLGAYAAKRIVTRIPQRRFRIVVAGFLGLVAAKLLFWP